MITTHENLKKLKWYKWGLKRSTQVAKSSRPHWDHISDVGKQTQEQVSEQTYSKQIGRQAAVSLYMPCFKRSILQLHLYWTVTGGVLT